MYKIMLLLMTHVTIHIYFSSSNTDTPEKKHSALCLGLSQFRKTLFLFSVRPVFAE